MTNYSENSGNVRVDRFKPGGKWYDTFELDMTSFYFYKPTPYDAVEAALKSSKNEHIRSIGNRVLNVPSPQMHGGMFLVCLEPYHDNAYPVVLWLA